jgi:hypothetical protein
VVCCRRYFGSRNDLCTAAGGGEPAGKAVARATGRGQFAIRLAKRYVLAGRVRRAAAVGVESDSDGIGRPLGVEGVVGCRCDYCVGGDLRTATGGGEPAGKAVARATGRGQWTIWLAKRYFLAGGNGRTAAVGVESDSDGIGRPLGVQGVVGRRCDYCVSGDLRTATGGGEPAGKAVARAVGRGQLAIRLAKRYLLADGNGQGHCRRWDRR